MGDPFSDSRDLVADVREYGRYDPARILVSSSTPGEKYAIDTRYLEQIVADLAAHARSYPPRFATSSDDRERAVGDVTMLCEMLEIAIDSPDPDPGLLLRAGLLRSIAYNLDVPGSAEKTAAIFETLLTAHPRDAEGNYIFGTFLAGAGKLQESIPYLQKASAAGVPDAAYALGGAYVAVGDSENALVNFERYQRERPHDRSVARMIDAIRSGHIKVGASKE